VDFKIQDSPGFPLQRGLPSLARRLIVAGAREEKPRSQDMGLFFCPLESNLL